MFLVRVRAFLCVFLCVLLCVCVCVCECSCVCSCECACVSFLVCVCVCVCECPHADAFVCECECRECMCTWQFHVCACVGARVSGRLATDSAPDPNDSCLVLCGAGSLQLPADGERACPLFVRSFLSSACVCSSVVRALCVQVPLAVVMKSGNPYLRLATTEKSTGGEEKHESTPQSVLCTAAKLSPFLSALSPHHFLAHMTHTAEEGEQTMVTHNTS